MEIKKENKNIGYGNLAYQDWAEEEEKYNPKYKEKKNKKKEKININK